MPDHTAQFRTIVRDTSLHKPATKASKRADKNKIATSYDVFTKEAYRIYEHVTSLKRFLLTIRRPYLSSESRPSSKSRKGASVTTTPNKKQQQQNDGSHSSLFSLFPSNIQSLTDNERDEIDFQAKIIIRRCMDRIKELEQAEQMRKQKQQKPAGLTQFFQSLLIPSMAEDTLALHRSSITWLLNKRLAEVSELQRNQQEIRLTRELERSENQLYKASSAKAAIEEDPVYKFEDYQEDNEPPAFQVDELSQEQMQMLEKENSTMLEELNNTLNQVKNAEKALLEISTLQNELTTHLAAQTAQTDRLYADAIASTERIEQGNVQLIQSRERNRGTRHFTLFFLLMASFVLLFLDWYA
ncbi:hypothetical protein BDB00DRAFT_809622 [Zychaea mexicana]|uniref:uncharacterized protein n=1 Tax=Zychaea mexicana TaxID=64656 RepID=UPI0022FE6650|nr:uncharacterized protein BDB00DRAFT_809622 [Zychaea mexicana]KAI9496245.1 hypothetical protein BDB00DRAFT_809622 [Zychaea mexicana]